MAPPKITERGREFVGYETEDDTKRTLTWRIWCTTELGRTYHRYVEITIPYSVEEINTWTAEDVKAFENKLNQENREQLDRAQANLEKIEAATWQVPERNWNAVREHTEGPCRCGLTHPPHNEGKCWCGTTHPAHVWYPGRCWCGKTGPHNVGTGRP